MLVVFYAFLTITFIQLLFYIGVFGRFSFAKIPTEIKTTPTIPISVIICAHNEAKNLKEFLPSFINQKYSNFELVLINDASYDDTLEIMEAFREKHPTKIKVVDVKANCSESKICTFNVTLEHEDSGWKHFANKWEIYTPDNKLLAIRTLHHPHVNEQPFTRSLSGVKIPKGLNKVIIKGHDLVHRYSEDVSVYEF